MIFKSSATRPTSSKETARRVRPSGVSINACLRVPLNTDGLGAGFGASGYSSLNR